MNTRMEPRFLVTGKYAWESMLGQVAVSTISSEIKSPANGAIITFKGNWGVGASDNKFDWSLGAVKRGGANIFVAMGTGVLGVVDDLVLDNIHYADNIIISNQLWFSDVKTIIPNDENLSTPALMYFDMFGFDSLICSVGPSSVEGCASIGVDVTWV